MLPDDTTEERFEEDEIDPFDEPAPAEVGTRGGFRLRQNDRDRKPLNAQEILTEEIKRRTERASPSLRNNLRGSILVTLDNRSCFEFDWSSDVVVAQACSKKNADCKIELSEQDFMRIFQGGLNPQVAMLSHKVNVSGRAELAVYFFNLLTPRN